MFTKGHGSPGQACEISCGELDSFGGSDSVPRLKGLSLWLCSPVPGFDPEPSLRARGFGDRRPRLHPDTPVIGDLVATDGELPDHVGFNRAALEAVGFEARYCWLVTDMTSEWPFWLAGQTLAGSFFRDCRQAGI